MGRVKEWLWSIEEGDELPESPEEPCPYRVAERFFVPGPGLLLEPGAVVGVAGDWLTVGERVYRVPGLVGAVRAGVLVFAE
jgi:hypothetical protein